MNRTLLQGVRVIELAGLAPVPHCGMVLADFGASVTLIEKVLPSKDFWQRDILFEEFKPNDKDETAMEQRLAGRKTRQGLDLRSSEDLAKLRQLCKDSDVLLDPYRPGVLEKMGLDPVELLEVCSFDRILGIT
ncbi:hypothetical protein ANCCAN_21571 [Ancylostoma caninum]|uniref:Uncharacterized protein n=1 Tax=Ancylostoma caninum TaxID=29170 RepID=A0A368FP50_ANCCA|nr:hypothetical protein ANCCAN_21571 [Ancylostoma caninum]